MTEKQRQAMYDAIEQHGKNLFRIFPFRSSDSPVSICKKLFSLENKTSKIMVDYCNGLIDLPTVDYATEKTFNILFRILNIAHNSPLAKILIINRDPRGYSLKISPDFITSNNISIYRDMGGYGILAPDFRIYKP